MPSGIKNIHVMSSENNLRREIEERVLNLFEEHLESDIALDTPLRENFDELDVMELFMAVEEEFELEISPMQEEFFETPEDFVDFICNALG